MGHYKICGVCWCQLSTRGYCESQDMWDMSVTNYHNGVWRNTKYVGSVVCNLVQQIMAHYKIKRVCLLQLSTEDNGAIQDMLGMLVTT